MEERPMREKTDAEVFAELCALPERFRFEVERVTHHGTVDRDAMEAARPADWTPLQHKEFEERLYRNAAPVLHWRITVTLLDSAGVPGPSLYGHDATLARAWAGVRMQIAAFTKIL